MLVRILPLTENKQNLRVNFIEIKDRKSHDIYLDLLPRGICYRQHVINDVHPESKINIISFLKAILFFTNLHVFRIFLLTSIFILQFT